MFNKMQSNQRNGFKFNMLTVAIAGLIVGLSSLISIPEAQAAEKTAGSKILILYYSLSGNTEQVAKYIQSKLTGDIVRIETVNPYPENYDTVVDQAKAELQSGFNPPLKTKVDNLADYDIIFVGSPNWWATIAAPVKSFLAQNDLSGKTIVPFITHGGSALARSVDDIKALCPNSTILEGLAIRDSKIGSSQADVDAWISKLAIVK